MATCATRSPMRLVDQLDDNRRTSRRCRGWSSRRDRPAPRAAPSDRASGTASARVPACRRPAGRRNPGPRGSACRGLRAAPAPRRWRTGRRRNCRPSAGPDRLGPAVVMVAGHRAVLGAAPHCPGWRRSCPNGRGRRRRRTSPRSGRRRWRRRTGNRRENRCAARLIGPSSRLRVGGRAGRAAQDQFGLEQHMPRLLPRRAMMSSSSSAQSRPASRTEERVAVKIGASLAVPQIAKVVVMDHHRDVAAHASGPASSMARRTPMAEIIEATRKAVGGAGRASIRARRRHGPASRSSRPRPSARDRRRSRAAASAAR